MCVRSKTIPFIRAFPPVVFPVLISCKWGCDNERKRLRVMTSGFEDHEPSARNDSKVRDIISGLLLLCLA